MISERSQAWILIVGVYVLAFAVLARFAVALLK